MGETIFAVEPLGHVSPIFDAVGQPLIVDHDDEVPIGMFAHMRVMLVDPVVTRMTAIEHDLGDPAVRSPFLLGEREHVLEFLKDHLDDAVELGTFRNRNMFDPMPHAFVSSIGSDTRPVSAFSAAILSSQTIRTTSDSSCAISPSQRNCSAVIL